jgi:hypothetical protein
MTVLDAGPTVAPTDAYSLASLLLNVVQTCFLAWLAVWARHKN